MGSGCGHFVFIFGFQKRIEALKEESEEKKERALQALALNKLAINPLFFQRHCDVRLVVVV